jgi:hypothetical protein
MARRGEARQGDVMKRGQEPMHPVAGEFLHNGLSVREHFASLALAGLLSQHREGESLPTGVLVEEAVHLADQLLRRLNEST